MGKRKFQDYISDECHRRYSCVHCRAHLANHDELISKVPEDIPVRRSMVFSKLFAIRSRSKGAREKPISSIKCEFIFVLR